MKGHNALKVVSLSSNLPFLTAIANDISYQDTLSYQLKVFLENNFAVNKTSPVILISSSGNSPNIVEAAKVARHLGSPLIGLTGFEGGELKKLSDISLHVPIHNYGVVEDCHQSLMHIIAQYIRKERDKI